MKETELLALHGHLHDKNIQAIRYQGVAYPIFKNREGLRYVTINGIKYIQQNPNKDTTYATMAKNGHKITWGIREGKWDLIVDNKVERFTE